MSVANQAGDFGGTFANILTENCGAFDKGLLATFNQDYTSVAVGSKNGFKIYAVNNIDKADLVYESDVGPVIIVERLFSSSLIMTVSEAFPRRLHVAHFLVGSTVCNYDYKNPIVAVRLNRSRVVVCLEESLYIHNIRDMVLIYTIKETPPNPRGLCSLSVNSDLNLLAYPGSSTIGEVQIFDLYNLKFHSMIPAHNSPLAALCFNASATQLATASEKGTVIRVFNVKDDTKLFEFRRGLKRCAQIYSLCFSPDSKFLALTSNTETIHIFRLLEATPPPDQASGEGGWMDYFTKAMTASTSYLPTQVFSQGRAFAQVQQPVQGLKSVCGLVYMKNQLRLLVAVADGCLYIYSVDTVDGGDCALVKQHMLIQK